MKETRADKIAQAAAHMHNPEWGTEARAGRRIYEGISYEAQDALPDNAIAAVLQRSEDNEAMVVAVHERRVWLIEFERSKEDDFDVIPVTTTMASLDPRRDHVSREARHRLTSSGPSKSLTWRFEIAGRKLEIPTHVSASGEADDREQVARALAAALGWHTAGALNPDDYRIKAL